MLSHISGNVISRIPIVFREYILRSLIQVTGTLQTLVFITYSPAQTFAIVTEISFPLSLRLSTVSCLIILTWAPESSSTFPRLQRLLEPNISAAVTRSIASPFSYNGATPMLTALLVCSNG